MADKVVPLPKYPAFVWCNSPHREKCVTPELWYHEVHMEQHVADGKHMVKPHAAFHTLKPEDMKFDVHTLARLYPPPAGFEWFRQQSVSIDADTRLNSYTETPNSEGPKPTE